MDKLEALPRFIEPGDDQDTAQALPIFVTRQRDNTMRTQRSTVLAAIKQLQSKARERLENV